MSEDQPRCKCGAYAKEGLFHPQTGLPCCSECFDPEDWQRIFRRAGAIVVRDGD